ncbi:MAG: ATP-dependent helicase [Eubacteriales bacterium]|nr:ATP-dependent helicase [Eubacteriales bacterium]
MSNINLSGIRLKIESLHQGDAQQLEVIFSKSPRLIVEAPAGYGKTTTMISRIAYLFASGSIPNPKRILGLTFSVNAALKVKRDVAGKLPDLLGSSNSPVALNEKVTVTNYHGFCKGVLHKYGYLVADVLRKDINLFKALGKIKNNRGEITSDWKSIARSLSIEEQEIINKIDVSIENGHVPGADDLQVYFEIIIKKLLPQDFITHNAVILFVLEIFERFPEVRKFYQNYYTLIVVDEFQDTNCIACELLGSIIVRDRTQLVFLGDPLQRIYGFIGALSNIMDTAADQHDMTKIKLNKNYRFRDNPEMLKLDRNIRANAADYFAPVISEDDVANLPAFWGVTQQEEAQKIVEKIQNIITDNPDRVAVLFRMRGLNAEKIESELSNRGIPYFYGMFTDEDPEYVEFHIKCQDMFIRKFGKSKTISHKALQMFAENVKMAYASSTEKTISSMFRLLDALVSKVSMDYADLQPDDKYDLLMDIFENRQLKQAMEYVDAKVILSTVHGAKGLEWDYVILADLERFAFPSYFTCEYCQNKSFAGEKCKCHLPTPLPERFIKTALDELSLFYVGVTRAKKAVFVSASAKQLAPFGEVPTLFSCMANIGGIRLVNAETA